MATSPHLQGKLRDAIGGDAAEELVAIVDKAASDISELRGDVAELRHEMEVGFARIERTVVDQIAGVKVDLSDKIAGVRSDLMKWSFVFWVGAVVSITLLALALQR